MGSGISGIYYTSHGSSYIHHDALIHVMEGDYDIISNGQNLHYGGGHSQDAMNLMDDKGINYVVTKTYDNGVRVGNILDSDQVFRQSGNNHSWFPSTWTTEKVTEAANYIAKNHNGGKLPDKGTIIDTFEGVRIIAQVKHGEIVSIYPDAKKQPSKK